MLGLAALARGGGIAAAAAPRPRPVSGASVADWSALAGAAACSGVLALLGNSVVLIVLLGFDFDPFRVAVFRPYPLVCYGVAALWVAAGMQWAMDRLPGWTAARWPAATGGLQRLGSLLPVLAGATAAGPAPSSRHCSAACRAGGADRRGDGGILVL